mgnify:CR=1 FL=1
MPHAMTTTSIPALLSTPVTALSDAELEQLTQELNVSYRKGNPLVSDFVYDHIYLKTLKEKAPHCDFVNKVEPEQLNAKGMIKHDIPMLSTQKANNLIELQAFIAKVKAMAIKLDIDFSLVNFKITPKLDGCSGRYKADKKQLLTRGDGAFGYDISNLLALGLNIENMQEDAVGEIIIAKAYFDEHLADEYANSRNCVAGIVNATTVKNGALKALNAGAVELVTFNTLPSVEFDGETLCDHIEEIGIQIRDNYKYLTDGLVIDVTHALLREKLGATSSFHNYQIAFKLADEEKNALITDINWTVGKGGRITPVISISPIKLSGVTISKLTGHNYENLNNLTGFGVGATISIARANAVIPTLKSLVTPTNNPLNAPTTCPCCQTPTITKGANLFCFNTDCVSRKAKLIEHHCKTVGADFFGAKTIEKLTLGGFTSIKSIYQMGITDFMDCDISEKMAHKLIAELTRVTSHSIDDFRLIASLGISKLGRGAASKILAVHPIDKFLALTAGDLEEIEGFAEKTAHSITVDLKYCAETLNFLLNAFNEIQHSSAPSLTGGALSDEIICFTGKMTSNTRDEMAMIAKEAGAKVTNSLTKACTLLVMGDKVGASKMAKADKNNVKMISEADFFNLL